MKRVMSVTRREFFGYFDSPIAYIFIVLFLLVSVWWFFDMAGFWHQKQATMRGYFSFLPLAFIVFIPAITMRLWAEERRMGTEELLLTMPIQPWESVMGKFLAALSLLAIALAGSIPLAVTVSYLGPLDWGPVIGGYLGALLLGGAGLALGLFLSALTKNQIIAFILTLVALFAFYLMGSVTVLQKLPSSVASWVNYISLGSHYESITRGVVDIRDVFYYLFFIGFFLFLNQMVLKWRKH